MTGRSFVNGLSVTYSSPSSSLIEILKKSGTADVISDVTQSYEREIRLQSPVFTSDCDCPESHTVVLSPLDRIIKITVRSGQLIDSIIFTVGRQIINPHQQDNSLHGMGSEGIKQAVAEADADVKVDVEADAEAEIVHSIGGTGGSVVKSLIVPPGWSFFGFYGGKGGHMHNIGVVLKRHQQR